MFPSLQIKKSKVDAKKNITSTLLYVKFLYLG